MTAATNLPAGHIFADYVPAECLTDVKIINGNGIVSASQSTINNSATEPTVPIEEVRYKTTVDAERDSDGQDEVIITKPSPIIGGQKIPRNAICPLCDSGIKYKKCCGKNVQ